jgi:hypothetical protein
LILEKEHNLSIRTDSRINFTQLKNGIADPNLAPQRCPEAGAATFVASMNTIIVPVLYNVFLARVLANAGSNLKIINRPVFN